MAMNAWKVYVSGVQIDTVFYTQDCDSEYVRTSLIDHDGYPRNIVVRKGD
jgi:hypothetical protein